jgi:hypothetical protein
VLAKSQNADEAVCERFIRAILVACKAPFQDVSIAHELSGLGSTRDVR